MSRPAATPTVQVDTDEVRVTKWTFPPGTATGWHRHEMDYVVVPLTHGPLTIQAADGSTMEAEIAPGASYARKAGVEHDVINATDNEIAFIEIELKAPVGPA